ncbi:hypothetical protein P691DRAFT_256010 [Macrolepiota fuliginosa MF-IS2]|uniref:Uncharacterized protein n=1 Tax=Macrolepiota fuliginosa MF-IS2 TaxID=1400762 RepID=A0A9P5X7T1_9AGAR|nr:hypothetical protein P691DRAFT_256010 [Macrolepiota fuliginosa MF-IS2]
MVRVHHRGSVQTLLTLFNASLTTNLIINALISSDLKMLSLKTASTTNSALACRMLIVWPKWPQDNVALSQYSPGVVGEEKERNEEHPGRQAAQIFSNLSMKTSRQYDHHRPYSNVKRTQSLKARKVVWSYNNDIGGWYVCFSANK